MAFKQIHNTLRGFANAFTSPFVVFGLGFVLRGDNLRLGRFWGIRQVSIHLDYRVMLPLEMRS
jgi:hypothetical protein